MLNNKTYWSIVIVFALLAVSVHAGNFTLNFTDSVNGSYISNVSINLTYTFYQEFANATTQEGGQAGTVAISTRNLYENYTNNAANLRSWQVKHGSLSTYNVTGLSQCFYSGQFLTWFQAQSSTGPSSIDFSYGSCYNFTTNSYSTVTAQQTSAGASPGVSGSSSSWIDGNYLTNASYYLNAVSYGAIVTEGSFFEDGVWWTKNILITNTSTLIVSPINNNWSIIDINATISAPGYSSKSINISNVTSNYTTTLTPNTFSVYVYNENTQTAINNTNVTIYLIGPMSNNYTVSNGTIIISGIITGAYQMIVSAPGYSTRTYYFSYSLSLTPSKTVYLLPAGYSAIVLSDVDSSYQSIPYYQNSLLRQNTTGVFYEVERCTGDSNGQCIISGTVCTTNDTTCPYYRIIVYDTSNNTVGDTGPLRFNSNSYTLLINPTNRIGPVNNYFNLNQFFTSFNTVNGIINYYFDNTNSVASNVVVTIKRRVGSSTTTLETLTSSSTGQIVLTSSATNLSLGDEFIASAYWIDSQGYVHQGDTEAYVPPDSGLGSSKGGILPFLFLGIVLAPLLLFDFSPPLAVGGSAAALYVVNIIGLSSFTTNVIGGIIVLGGIVLWLVFK